MPRSRKLPEVLMLEEAARYLRFPEETVRRQAASGDLPARQFGKAWRFLKAAVDGWLCRPNSRTAFLETFGACADDETLPELRRLIYAARGRPEVEDRHGR